MEATALHSDVAPVDSPIESWILSTASCYHVTQQRELFENYTSGNYGKVYQINGESMDVVGKGDVRIKLSSNVTWTLRDVKHIPGHIWNIISVSELTQSGKCEGISFSSQGIQVFAGDFNFTIPRDPNAPNCITYLSASRP